MFLFHPFFLFASRPTLLSVAFICSLPYTLESTGVCEKWRWFRNPSWLNDPHHGLQYPVKLAVRRYAMDTLGKTIKSGPFGTKEQNKKHMTPCEITCIHWGGHSGYRMGRDLMQWRRMKELVFLQHLANQSRECHVRYGASWGALSEHCFSSGGVMEAISDSSPFT